MAIELDASARRNMTVRTMPALLPIGAALMAVLYGLRYLEVISF